MPAIRICFQAVYVRCSKIHLLLFKCITENHLEPEKIEKHTKEENTHTYTHNPREEL